VPGFGVTAPRSAVADVATMSEAPATPYGGIEFSSTIHRSEETLACNSTCNHEEIRHEAHQRRPGRAGGRSTRGSRAADVLIVSGFADIPRSAPAYSGHATAAADSQSTGELIPPTTASADQPTTATQADTGRAVRASDAGWEHAVRRLHQALGEGRLNLQETETRVAAAYTAVIEENFPSRGPR
jgi:hypothetical protein